MYLSFAVHTYIHTYANVVMYMYVCGTLVQLYKQKSREHHKQF